MTEQEYLDATNLARVRVAISTMRFCTFLDADESTDSDLIVATLYALESALERRVNIKEEE
jgi:hypothetical protein